MDHHLRAQTLHSSIKNNCTIIFFHPDYTVGSGITPDHASRPAGFTAGRESHPALKISFFYHNTLYIICKAKVWKWQTPFHIDFICQFCYSIRIDYCHLRIRRI